MESSYFNIKKPEEEVENFFSSQNKLINENPINFNKALNKSNELSKQELYYLKQNLSHYKSINLPEPSSQTSDYTVPLEDNLSTKKNITSIKEVQMILSTLSTEVVFFYTLKRYNELLMQVRTSTQKYQNEKALETFKTCHATGFISFPALEEMSNLMEAIYFRFKDRNLLAGYLNGDERLLKHALEIGAEQEKAVAKQIFDFLNIEKSNHLLDVYWDLIPQIIEDLISKMDSDQSFHLFYCSNRFRFKLLKLSIEESIEKLETVLQANIDTHYFVYIQSNLDKLLMQRKMLLSEWERKCHSLIETYKKVFEIGKKLIRGNLSLYKQCFTRSICQGIPFFSQLQFSEMLDPPDAFEKKVLSLFETSQESTQKKLSSKTVKEKKKPKSTKSKNTKTEKNRKSKKNHCTDQKEECPADKTPPISTFSLSAPFPYRYASRVSRWWKEIPEEYQSLSLLDQSLQRTFHRFSLAVDDYVFSYGIKAKWPNETTHALDTIHLVPGTIFFKNEGKTFRGVFTYCIGQDNKLYHRYFSRNLRIYALPEVNVAFRYFDFPSLEQVIAKDLRFQDQQIVIVNPQKKEEDPIFFDPILQTIQIEDTLNEATITLFWTPEKGREITLLSPAIN